MKSEDALTSSIENPKDVPHDEQLDSPPRKKRGRPRRSDVAIADTTPKSSAKKLKKSLETSTPQDEALSTPGETTTTTTPKTKKGRKKKTDTLNGTDTPQRPSTKPTTKAGLAGTTEKDASYSYADLFPGDEDQDDENVDAGDDDSEYAPSDDEVEPRFSSSSKRKGGNSRHRRSKKSQPPEHLEGSTDEDEIGESESEFEDDEEDLTLERIDSGQAEATDAPVALFEDEMHTKAKKDVYDFEAQSIVSDPRSRAGRKRAPAITAPPGASDQTGSRPIGNATARVTSHRGNRRNNTGQASTWGSNIYSALAASLRTRADLDAYSNFLKSNVLNDSFDRFVAETCKPSAQHSNLFYGVSASLQSLMSRINDYDKVVELLHAFVSRPFDQARHRIACLAPIIHQPLFGLSYIPPVTQAVNGLAKSLDPEMSIRPAYVLNQDTNLLAMPNATLHEFGVSVSQYNLITSTGNMGRFMPDIKQLVVSSDFFTKLNDFVTQPPEKVYEIASSRAHQRQEDHAVDISPIEPANLQRLVMILDSNGTMVGVALLDYWNESELPTLTEPVIELVDVHLPDENHNGNGETLEQPSKKAEGETESLKLFDDTAEPVPVDAEASDTAPEKQNQSKPNLEQLHFVDALLIKPNGRRDHLLLVGHVVNCRPPLENVSENDTFRVYSVVDESRIMLEKHGFSTELPVSLEGVHTTDMDNVMDDQSLLVVPDILYDTLRKVLLRELIGSTGTPTTVMNPKKPDGFINPAPATQCTKFVILDRVRRVPLAVVFDSPVRLTLQVSAEEPKLNPFGEAASKQFDQLTQTELKTIESAFEPSSAEYRLVTVGGLLFGMQIDEQRVIHRVIEIAPARFDAVFPHTLRPTLCAQSIVGSAHSCASSVRIVNDETNSSTVLPAFLYPQYRRQQHSTIACAFSQLMLNQLFTLPIQVSLYDIMFRLGQKHMPELLARQHIEAAESAAYAEAAANPHAPPPAPVPLPENWGVCCICSKELRSTNGLLDHEMRHIGLSRFRCVSHNTSFLDRRQWQSHMNEMHSTTRASALNALPRPSTGNADASDADDDDEEVNEPEAAPGSGLLAGLSQVFTMGVLVGRMEAPQCEKCGDYFLNADILARHIDFCDGVSFCVRAPIAKPQKSIAADETVLGTNASTVDADESIVNDDINESKSDACICGMCGAQVASRDKILRHLSVYHLQCTLCNAMTRSLEELTCHYQSHLKTDFAIPIDDQEEEANGIMPPTKQEAEGDTEDTSEAVKSTNAKKVQLQKLMACDICTNFCGTKYNYYFHQWVEHGVVSPPFNSADGGTPQIIAHARQVRQTADRDDMYYSMTGVRRMKCKFCGLILRVTGKEYITHLGEKHGVYADPEVICRICAELFETPEHLSSHLGETHILTGEYGNAGVQTIFRCTHCEFWGFLKGLLKHARDMHGDAAPAIYECTHCYERFSDKRCWRTHMDKHNEGYSQRCLECGRAFRLRASLLHHIRTHHGEDQGPATCEYCGLTYPKRGSLRYHIFRMHNQELDHECTMCQRRFRLENELRRHMKETHSGAVRCEICHKVCANLRCYAQHRQKHFRTRIYQCTDCQTTFKSKLAMKRHIRVEHLQLGPERFECQICGKIVTQIGMHMLIHKEARFECEYCSKRFTKAAYYNEHLRIHLGEQPFECHICQKKFNKKSNLNVHLKFHERHRDEEGNYLELKPRGRVSTMFGDAHMSPSARAARQAASTRGSHVKVDVSVGSDLPGAFNVTAGPSGAAAEATERMLELFGMDCDVMPITETLVLKPADDPQMDGLFLLPQSDLP